MLQPTSLNELSAMVRESTGPLTPRGAGLHQHLGNPAHPDSTVIDCTRLNQVADYVASDLTITVGAGITLGALQDILAAHRQWLPWDAPQYREASVAGLLAAGLSGPLRHGAGAPRDWLLGMKFVIGDGRLIKSGGKVVKNVAGYDLHKLHLGALGTLGIIGEVSFKVAPMPLTDATLLFHCATPDEAHRLAYTLRQRPFNPTALMTVVQPGSCALWVRWQGVQAAVMRQIAHARQQSPHVEEVPSADWEVLSNEPFRTAQRTQVRIGVPPQHMLAVYPLLSQYGSAAHIQILPTVGLIRIYAPQLPDMVALRSALEPLQGYAVVEIGDHADRWGAEPAGAAIMRQLKQTWDPTNKFNPGRYIIG